MARRRWARQPAPVRSHPDGHTDAADGWLQRHRAIRALPGWEQVPILALTASAFEEDRKACESAGMNDFIAKPVTPAKLFEALQQWLPHSTATAPNTNGGRPTC